MAPLASASVTGRPPPRLHQLDPETGFALTEVGWRRVTVLGVLGNHLVVVWQVGPRVGTLGWLRSEFVRRDGRRRPRTPLATPT